MPLAVVIHQARSAENLGAVCRVMANFGLERLILSDPWRWDLRAAERIAVGAEDILRRVEICRNMDEALAGMTMCIGTTSRPKLHGREVLDPAAAAAAVRLRSVGGTTALVFGGEKRGLSDDDLSRCQVVMRIPTQEPQPSMNLSHAVAIAAYCVRSEMDKSPGSRTAPQTGNSATRNARTNDDQVATRRVVGAMREVIERVVGNTDFVNPQKPDHAVAEVFRALDRAGLTVREAGILKSMFEHIERSQVSGQDEMPVSRKPG